MRKAANVNYSVLVTPAMGRGVYCGRATALSGSLCWGAKTGTRPAALTACKEPGEGFEGLGPVTAAVVHQDDRAGRELVDDAVHDRS